MRERSVLKIGEFARVGEVSIATLRHYDQCGLLKPNAQDPDTGYRYYSLDQLPRLNRILALKELTEIKLHSSVVRNACPQHPAGNPEAPRGRREDPHCARWPARRNVTG